METADEEEDEEEALPADETLEQVPLKMLDASVEVKDPLEVVAAPKQSPSLRVLAPSRSFSLALSEMQLPS